jgi:hypothetical protein
MRKNQGRAAVWLFLLSVVCLLIYWGMFAFHEEGSPEERWAKEAWKHLRSGQAAIPWGERADKTVLLATHVPTVSFGFLPREILRCDEVVLASESRIDLRFPQSSQAEIIFSRPDGLPYVLPVPREITAKPVASGVNEPAGSVSQDEKRVRDFLASVPCGLTWPIADLASESFLSHLNITLFPALVKPGLSEEEAALYLGPLYKLDRLPKIPGEELPAGAISLPDDVASFPRAFGLVLRGIKITPSPVIDWTADFKTRLSGVPALAGYANIWEQRQNGLATWVPQLSDDVGTLLGSGYIRFNRPEVLPTTSTHLFPMDELHILRAFHACGIESGPLAWYPHPARSGNPAIVDSAWISGNATSVRDSGELHMKLASEPGYLSPVFSVASGDLVIGDCPQTETVVVSLGSGSITLKGRKPGNPLLLIVESGDIFVDCSEANAYLIALDGIGSGVGGRVVFRREAVVRGNVRARSVVVETPGSHVQFSPPEFPRPDRIPLVFRGPR